MQSSPYKAFGKDEPFTQVLITGIPHSKRKNSVLVTTAILGDGFRNMNGKENISEQIHMDACGKILA